MDLGHNLTSLDYLCTSAQTIRDNGVWWAQNQRSLSTLRGVLREYLDRLNQQLHLKPQQHLLKFIVGCVCAVWMCVVCLLQATSAAAEGLIKCAAACRNLEEPPRFKEIACEIKATGETSILRIRLATL